MSRTGDRRQARDSLRPLPAAEAPVHFYRYSRICVAAALLILQVRPGAVLAADFIGLGVYPGAEATSFSTARGVSDDGAVVVGDTYDNASSPVKQEAFRWTPAGGLALLANSPAFSYTMAFGVSADGGTIAGISSDSPGGEFGVVWTSGSTLPLFPFGSPEAGLISFRANSVSADGTFVGGYAYSARTDPAYTGNEAFRWSASDGAEPLGVIAGAPAFGSTGSFLSADGSVVAGASRSPDSGSEAFRWTSAGGMVGLGDLPGGTFRSRAYGISPDGNTVVGSATGAGGAEAFRWTQATGMQGLGNLPGLTDCQALDASSGGQIIVGICAPFGASTAFIWTAAGGMQELRGYLVARGTTGLNGWTRLYSAEALSSDGQWIVGAGENPDGRTEAFRVRVTAPPSDTDGDGVADPVDNCTFRANPSQCDSDGDGHGNHCDGDLNNNGFTNAQDTTLFRQQLGQPSVAPTYNYADLNCNGFVNAQDTTLFRSLLGSPPGPAGDTP